MPVQLFSRIRTVRFRKKKPKPPKPPTKPLRRLKSKIKKACNSMADRFRSRRPNPPPGNTNSNNNVVSTTGRVAPIQGNVTPGRTSLSSQKSPVRATAPVDAVVRIQESGGVSKMLQQPPSTSVLPSKPKVPSGELSNIVINFTSKWHTMSYQLQGIVCKAWTPGRSILMWFCQLA